MNNHVVLSNMFGASGVCLLTTNTGEISPCKEIGRRSQGNFHTIGDSIFALYVENGSLFFQWDKRRWELSGLSIQMSYGHNIQNKSSVFIIEEQSIEYPAWWASDPTFDPNIPERDEEEDYLAYVFAVWNQPELQHALTVAWSNPKGEGV